MTFHEFGDDTHPHIMLIHGGGNAWWNYLRQARVLAQHYHVILPTLDGHGEEYRTPYVSTERTADQLMDYIQQHYAEALTNAALGARFHYHPNYISRLIADRTGMPLHRYLLTIRIRQALSLLQTTALPVGEIARRTGFPNVSYFSHYFKKITGHCPGDFRMNGRP